MVRTAASEFIVDSQSQITVTLPTGASSAKISVTSVAGTASREYHTYLKFQISGLVGPVQSAKLRMLVESSSDDGGSIYLVSNNYAGTTTPWEESGLTWNNGPLLTGNVLSSLGEIKSGTMVEFDVSSAINGNGIYSFAIKNGSSDSGRYSSKEGSTAPELIIEASTSPSSSP